MLLIKLFLNLNSILGISTNNYNMKILFLGRSKDIYSKKIFLELKKKYKNTIFVKSRKIGDKLPKKFNKNFDIVYSFRNYIILKKVF